MVSFFIKWFFSLFFFLLFVSLFPHPTMILSFVCTHHNFYNNNTHKTNKRARTKQHFFSVSNTKFNESEMHRVLSYQTAMQINDDRDIRTYITKRTCISLIFSASFFTLILGKTNVTHQLTFVQNLIFKQPTTYLGNCPIFMLFYDFDGYF